MSASASTAGAVSVLVADYAGSSAAQERAVAVERAVELVYGGIPFAVMMTTPADLDDFAVGFSLTEGVIERAADIRGIQHVEAEQGARLLVDLVPERMKTHLARRRALAGRTGCGVCGIEDLDALHRAVPGGGTPARIAPAAVGRALAALDAAQDLGRTTRAVHAAAWATPDGTLVVVREDVGRHNALDKLIGALARRDADPGDGFCLITSRCSFEMVEKLAAFGGRTLVAISAPTSLALERAKDLGVAVAATARADTMTVYAGQERFGL